MNNKGETFFLATLLVAAIMILVVTVDEQTREEPQHENKIYSESYK